MQKLKAWPELSGLAALFVRHTKVVRVFVIHIKLHISWSSVLSKLRPWSECRTAGGPNREKMRLTKCGCIGFWSRVANASHDLVK